MSVPDSPITREEQFLNVIAGSSGPLPDVPLTRKEQYLAKIAGQDVELPDVPLTREEMYLAEIAANGGGGSGGNPNSVQTITGTAANPWGDVDYAELAEAISNNNASATIGYELGDTILYPRPMVANSSSLWASMLNSGADGGWTAFYNSSGAITSLKALVSGSPVDYISYAPFVTSTLTIIWHPLTGSLPNASGVSF